MEPKLFGFAKSYRFSFFAPSSSVQLYCLFYVTLSISCDVTFQSYDVEILKDKKMYRTILGVLSVEFVDRATARELL